MGLFDGATAETGSTADIAAMTGWPVVLIVDARAQAASAAAVVRGFAEHRADVRVAGVVFNRVASERHRRHILDAMAALRVGRVRRWGRRARRYARARRERGRREEAQGGTYQKN